MKISYLEIVTPDADNVCALYSELFSAEFGPPDPSLGNARTCRLPDGGMIGIRRPMHEQEQPVVRPYLNTASVQETAQTAGAQGAEVILPPMELPGHGACTIFTLGGIQHAAWQDA